MRLRTSAALLAAALAVTAPTIAFAHGPGTVEPVAKGHLASTDRTVVVAKIHLEPGGYIDWHRHPGKVTGVVTGGGTLTILNRGCEELVYPTGAAFHPPLSTHTARNFSTEPVTIVATFEVRGTAPTVMADATTDAALDELCSLQE